MTMLPKSPEPTIVGACCSVVAVHFRLRQTSAGQVGATGQLFT